MGDGFHRRSKSGKLKPGKWSEQGEMIFDDDAEIKMVAAQKCDIASDAIPLTPTEDGVDAEKFKSEMEHRGG